MECGARESEGWSVEQGRVRGGMVKQATLPSTFLPEVLRSPPRESTQRKQKYHKS